MQPKLPGQVGAARVDEVDARKTIFVGNLLGAEVLLHRDRVITPSLNRRIVGNDHTFDTVQYEEVRLESK